MNTFDQALGGLSGGRVLDVATGEGGFVNLLAERLREYRGIIGIDRSGGVLAVACERCAGKNARFLQMAGERLGFANGGFDMVSLSASLHHLVERRAVLAELERVLRPGGHAILAEMHRDGQSEAQQNVIALHHWIAAVDAAQGIDHFATLTRGELVELFESLGLIDVVCYDLRNVESDPDATLDVQELEGVIDRALVQAQELPEGDRLCAQGEALRYRLQQRGAQREPVVILVGRKPDGGSCRG